MTTRPSHSKDTSRSAPNNIPDMYGSCSLFLITVSLLLAVTSLIQGQIKFDMVAEDVDPVNNPMKPAQLDRCIVCKGASTNGECNTDARVCQDNTGSATGCKSVVMRWPGGRETLYEKDCLTQDENCPSSSSHVTCKKLWDYEMCTHCCYGDLCNLEEQASGEVGLQ